MRFPGLLRLIQANFLTGALVLLPFVVVGWVVGWIVGTLWRLHLFLPEAWHPEAFDQNPALENLVNLLFTVGATAVLILGISLLGWISKQFLGRKALEFAADVIQRIPVLRSVYGALDQLLRTLASGGGKQFSRVVYVEYPRKGIWALAFVTGPAQGPNVPPGHLNVYVPTTPNPTSGFHLLVPEAEVRESHLRVEEAFRTILSLGIAQGPAAGRS